MYFINNLAEKIPKLIQCVLFLLKACLGYDFIGTIPDETEDIGTIQIPSAWKPFVTEFSTIKLLVDGYNQATGPSASSFLECLSMIVSIRRSIFANEAERGNFLELVFEALIGILESEHAFNEPENIFEFARLLTRLKSVNQLSEMIEKPSYNNWIELVVRFTFKSFLPDNVFIINLVVSSKRAILVKFLGENGYFSYK